MSIPILSLIIFLPLVGMVIILFLDKERHVRGIRTVATVFAAADFLVSLGALAAYPWGNSQMAFQEQGSWIPSLHVFYSLGADGLSLPLVVLTTLLSLLCIVYSYRIQDRVKEYMAFFLLLEVWMLGVFLSLDLILFYVFWEISLVPMYFIIGIWGGPRKEYASIKFFIYTLVGSMAMLLGILVLYFSGDHSFNMLHLAQTQPLAFGGWRAILVFWGLFLGFAIKVPMFPFHTWLPDAHVEAPTAGSVILAGVLLKMGGYGFLRISLPIMPQQFRQFAVVVALLAVIAIVYGALVAMAQTDLKKLIAYSSVNHMGYVMLGISAAAASLPTGANMLSKATALNGATLQMVNHGLITGALFFLVGVIYDRAHLRDLDAFGGLSKRLPVYAGLMMFMCFASLGLPGLAGFVSEFLVFLGSFGAAGLLYQVLTGVSLLGVVFTAALFLWMIQRMFLGELNPRWAALKDMDRGELFAIVPLAVLTLAVGIYPLPLLNLINGAMTNILALVR
jgi:NADH-quinone oxidoreductase subunit M